MENQILNDISEIQANEISFLTGEIFSLLPDFVQRFLNEFETNKEKELMLISFLTVCSATFYNVASIYDGNNVYPNLFTFILGKPASGKGRMKYALKLIRDYFRTKDASNNVHKGFIISANNTGTGLMKNLQANESKGLLFDTEADTLANANKSEHGNFSELLRKCFQNESASINRGDPSKVFEIERLRFAVLLSGTSEQRDKIIQNSKDGLLTRFIYWSIEQDNTFKDVYAEKTSIEDKIQPLAIEFQEFLVQIHKFEEINCIVSQEVRELLNQDFRETVFSQDEESELNSLIFRMGLICHKLMVVIATLRLIGNTNIKPTTEIAIEDYLIAKSMTDVFLDNAIMYYKTFEQSDNTTKLFRILPSEFQAKDFVKYAQALNWSQKTIERLINDLVNQSRIFKTKHGHYSKTKPEN